MSHFINTHLPSGKTPPVETKALAPYYRLTSLMRLPGKTGTGVYNEATLYWKNVVNNISVNFGTANTTNKCLLGFSYQANSGSGGAWFSLEDEVRCAARNYQTPDNPGPFGFRVARTIGG